VRRLGEGVGLLHQGDFVLGQVLACAGQEVVNVHVGFCQNSCLDSTLI